MAIPNVTEAQLMADLLQGVSELLNQEVDTYEERIAADGSVVHVKTGTRRIVTAANIQAANSALNSKAAQKWFQEQKRNKTVNVRKGLAEEKQRQLEVQDE